MLNSFCSSILLQLESSSFWEYWVLSRWQNTRIQASHIQYPVRFCYFDIVQTSLSPGQHFCSKFAKIPHLGCPRTFKVPTSSRGPPPPPSGITLIAALRQSAIFKDKLCGFDQKRIRKFLTRMEGNMHHLLLNQF